MWWSSRFHIVTEEPVFQVFQLMCEIWPGIQLRSLSTRIPEIKFKTLISFAPTPVTQLYVSIDASNKESLRRIDRPLHRDYWERFIRCMDILREKRFTHRETSRSTLLLPRNPRLSASSSPLSSPCSMSCIGSCFWKIESELFWREPNPESLQLGEAGLAGDASV